MPWNVTRCKQPQKNCYAQRKLDCTSGITCRRRNSLLRHVIVATNTKAWSTEDWNWLERWRHLVYMGAAPNMSTAKHSRVRQRREKVHRLPQLIPVLSNVICVLMAIGPEIPFQPALLGCRFNALTNPPYAQSRLPPHGVAIAPAAPWGQWVHPEERGTTRLRRITIALIIVIIITISIYNTSE